MEHLHDGAAHDHGAATGRCPLCLAREVGRSVGPDVVGHLVAAGRELALAVGAALDAHAAAHAGAVDRPDEQQQREDADGAADAAADGGGVRRLRRIPVE